MLGKLRGFAKVTQDLTLRRHTDQQQAHSCASRPRAGGGEDQPIKDEFLAVLSHELRTP